MASLTISIPESCTARSEHSRARSVVRKPPSHGHRTCRSLSARRGSQSASVIAACRFRPLLPREPDRGNIRYLSDRSLQISHGSETQDFTLDRVFPPDSSQEAVFQFLGQSVVDSVLAGFNGTIFAYGQTGSGKTYTMIGGSDTASQGLIPRCSALLLTALKGRKVTCSMVEIYREKLYDLLRPDQRELAVKENPQNGVFMLGVREVLVETEQDVLRALRLGLDQRTVASTAFNECSSRSHAIFTLKVTSAHGVTQLNLVDLAGSERLSTLPVPASIVQDARKINLSLSVLGSVITALAARADHVPYRDSKLTRVLQESLGGNCKTHVVVNCSPAESSVEETLMSLRFAQRTKRVKSEVFAASGKSDYHSQIECLERELKTTREELQRYKEKTIDTSLPPITPRQQKRKDHDSSPLSFECSTTYRVLTENGEDWYFDSGKKQLFTPEPETDSSRQAVDSALKRQLKDAQEVKQQRDDARADNKRLCEKLRHLALKLNACKSRQDSDAEKRKILMLKIASDESLVAHMKSRISVLTRQVHDLTGALEAIEGGDSHCDWERLCLEAKLSIKESLCAVQTRQVTQLEATVDQMRRTATHLRNQLLQAYRDLADAKFAQCSKSQQLFDFLDCENHESAAGRFSYTDGSGDSEYVSKKLRLAEQELKEKEAEITQKDDALKLAKVHIANLQETLTKYQMQVFDRLQGRTEGRAVTLISGDTQPPDDC